MKNTKLRKALVLACSALLLVTITIGATVAYLTDFSETVVNTFTTGRVELTLDEADVNEYGVEIEGADRVTENSYKLIPGHTYTKDPTVTVVAGSEEAYVRMIVTVEDYADLKGALPTEYVSGDMVLLEKLVEGWDSAKWLSTSFKAEDGKGVYEFRYAEVVDARSKAQELPALFKSFTLPGEINNQNLAKLEGLEINVVAHAIQKDTFASAEAAWKAFVPQDAVAVNP